MGYNADFLISGFLIYAIAIYCVLVKKGVRNTKHAKTCCSVNGNMPANSFWETSCSQGDGLKIMEDTLNSPLD